MLNSRDERNITRLALVMAPNRVAETLTSWEKELSLGPLGSLKVSCHSLSGQVVPHGLDNDLLLGAINSFIEQGMPENDTVVLSLRHLCLLSAITPGGRQRGAVLASLDRLQGSSFRFTETWFRAGRGKMITEQFSLLASFRVLEDLDLVEVDSPRPPQSEAMLELVLGKPLARSIREGYTRPLDLSVYRELSQPMVRTLYRLLSETRLGLPATEPVHYLIPVRAWATHLGMHDFEISKVRRALEPAHQELVLRGFLKEATYLGRGETQQLRYTYGRSVVAHADPNQVALLTGRGLALGPAMTLLGQYPETAIRQAVTQFDALIAAGYKARSHGGLLTDILRSPEKYLQVEGNAPDQRTVADRRRKVLPAAVATVNVAPQETTDPQGAARGVLAALVAQEKLTADEAQACLALMADGRVSLGEVASLSVAKERGAAQRVAQWLTRQVPLISQSPT
jgi:plasmid replication initiation protein